MPVIFKMPGSPLFAKKMNGGYELYQGFAGLGATVLAAPAHQPGPPGVWSAQAIGRDGSYGPERLVNRNMASPIGGGDPHGVKLFLTRPISGMMGIDTTSPMSWLVRMVIGFAGAAVLATVLSKRMVRNSSVVAEIDVFVKSLKKDAYLNDTSKERMQEQYRNLFYKALSEENEAASDDNDSLEKQITEAREKLKDEFENASDRWDERAWKILERET